MLFANLTIRLFGSDDFPLEAKQQAVTDLTEAARTGDLTIPIADPLPLEQAAAAHETVDRGSRQRVLLVPEGDRGDCGG
jgi:NADPH2:quinone reductase